MEHVPEGDVAQMLRSSGAPAEGVEEYENFELAEVFGESDHAEGVQAQAQRVALHARVVTRQVPQVRGKRLHTHDQARR